jgi:hypothetical protein
VSPLPPPRMSAVTERVRTGIAGRLSYSGALSACSTHWSIRSKASCKRSSAYCREPSGELAMASFSASQMQYRPLLGVARTE